MTTLKFGTKIFVGGISNDILESDLTRYFEKFSKIEDCVIMVDKKTNHSRGFGFITVEDFHKAESVLKSQPHIIKGKRIECKLAIPKDIINESLPPEEHFKKKPIKDISFYYRKLFVGGLPMLMKEKDLLKYFQRFGDVEKCIIKKDEITGKSRGFGFVIFVTKESIDVVLSYGCNHFVLGKWIEIKIATPKEKTFASLGSSILNSNSNNNNNNNGNNNNNARMLSEMQMQQDQNAMMNSINYMNSSNQGGNEDMNLNESYHSSQSMTINSNANANNGNSNENEEGENNNNNNDENGEEDNDYDYDYEDQDDNGNGNGNGNGNEYNTEGNDMNYYHNTELNMYHKQNFNDAFATLPNNNWSPSNTQTQPNLFLYENYIPKKQKAFFNKLNNQTQANTQSSNNNSQQINTQGNAYSKSNSNNNNCNSNSNGNNGNSNGSNYYNTNNTSSSSKSLKPYQNQNSNQSQTQSQSNTTTETNKKPVHSLFLNTQKDKEEYTLKPPIQLFQTQHNNNTNTSTTTNSNSHSNNILLSSSSSQNLFGMTSQQNSIDTNNTSIHHHHHHNQYINNNSNNSNINSTSNTPNPSSNGKFSHYFNNCITHPYFNSYFHYKLFDSNGEEISKLTYKNSDKVTLFVDDKQQQPINNENANFTYVNDPLSNTELKLIIEEKIDREDLMLNDNVIKIIDTIPLIDRDIEPNQSSQSNQDSQSQQGRNVGFHSDNNTDNNNKSTDSSSYKPY